MKLAIDFDGTIVGQEHPYDDLVTPLRFLPGARENLWRLRAAGHRLLLWSGRSNRALLYDASWDPMVRAGRAPASTRGIAAAHDLNWGRYRQMLEFVERELPGVFHAVDDGLQGKPSADLFIDDRGWRSTVSWAEIGRELGSDWLPWARPRVVSEYAHYEDVRDSLWALPVPLNDRVRIRPVGWTDVGPVLAVDLLPHRAGGQDSRLQRVAVIAGQHGEEQAGVSAVCNGWESLLDATTRLNLHLRVYPCVNPEGYDRALRYNAREQRPTNAALEYQVGPTTWLGEVSPGQAWSATRRCAGASDESRWLVNDLQAFRPAAVLDLHQDSLVPVGGAFAYTFGLRGPYARIMRQSSAAPVANTRLRNESWTAAAPDLRTDGHGLSTLQDGSVTAWAWLAGARLSACLETSTRGHDFAAAISRSWVLGFLEAVAAGATARAVDPVPGDAVA